MYSIASFFAGVGGIDLGFELTIYMQMKWIHILYKRLKLTFLLK